ncbi:GTP-binding protein [Halomicronema hongdechloris C2206]|uniref:GTP-binding protein n=1 Tax=Halomicronema hongdechloris C2206 TaxID=1641165 RepID=A0A1Z3HJ43_9CYAN|nr:DUF697 domain-containing protein [Halomicronema hongdechloris]ASC70127.1 GTP-binding protein [Halomicronema hongdechloris C2206]
MTLTRPILIGGLGLTAVLGLLNGLHDSLTDHATLLVLMGVGSGVWWWRRRRQQPSSPVVPSSPVDRAAVDRLLALTTEQLDTLTTEIREHLDPEDRGPWLSRVEGLRQQGTALAEDLDRQTLTLALLGDPGVGKSTLRHHLSETWLPSLATTVMLQEGTTTLPAEQDPDILLWVTATDLTDSALASLRHYQQLGHRLVLVFNKQDQYGPLDRATMQQQLHQHSQSLPETIPVVAVTAQPGPLKVRRHQPNGSVEEWLETPQPETTDLLEHLRELVQQQQQELVLATAMRQGQQLQRRVRDHLNQLRRQRAMPTVERLQWIAAATAFANPLPSLDVLATAAINGQLVMDLGRIYQQGFSWQQAKATATTLAKLTVQLGLVELSSQALTSFLKSHAATYVAGGVVQGLSAAYLTRLAGLSLIDHFEEQSGRGSEAAPLSVQSLSQRLRPLMKQSQQSDWFKDLVAEGLSRLHRPADAAPTPVALATASAEPINLPESLLCDQDNASTD